MLREQQEWRDSRETFPAEEWRSGVNPVTYSTPRRSPFSGEKQLPLSLYPPDYYYSLCMRSFYFFHVLF